MKSIIKKTLTSTCLVSVLFFTGSSLGRKVVTMDSNTGKALNNLNEYIWKTKKEIDKKYLSKKQINKKLDKLVKMGYIEEAMQTMIEDKIVKRNEKEFAQNIFLDFIKILRPFQLKFMAGEFDKLDNNGKEALLKQYNKKINKIEEKIQPKELSSFSCNYIEKLKEVNDHLYFLIDSIIQKIGDKRPNYMAIVYDKLYNDKKISKNEWKQAQKMIKKNPRYNPTLTAIANKKLTLKEIIKYAKAIDKAKKLLYGDKKNINYNKLQQIWKNAKNASEKMYEYNPDMAQILKKYNHLEAFKNAIEIDKATEEIIEKITKEQTIMLREKRTIKQIFAKMPYYKKWMTMRIMSLPSSPN